MAGLARALALTFLWSACGYAEDTGEAGKAALEESFQLSVGRSTIVDGIALEIGFQSVASDSRCPKGEVCIWEGDATVCVWVRSAAGAKEERLLHTSSKGQSDAEFDNWTIRLVALDPYPVSGRAIPQAGYVATLRVTSGPSVDGDIQ